MTFRLGCRCNYCKGERIAAARRIDHSVVEDYFIKQGCELLEEYRNANQPLLYRCSCGNESRTRYSHFINGVRCKSCGYKKQARYGSDVHNWIEDREAYEAYQSFRNRCKRMLRTFFDFTGKMKTNHTAELLGYKPQDLQSYILSHPGYEHACRNGRLSIDHVIPIRAFVSNGFGEPEHLYMINALENLQPMDRTDNSIKNDMYDIEALRSYVKKFGHDLS